MIYILGSIYYIFFQNNNNYDLFRTQLHILNYSALGTHGTICNRQICSQLLYQRYAIREVSMQPSDIHQLIYNQQISNLQIGMKGNQ